MKDYNEFVDRMCQYHERLLDALDPQQCARPTHTSAGHYGSVFNGVQCIDEFPNSTNSNMFPNIMKILGLTHYSAPKLQHHDILSLFVL